MRKSKLMQPELPYPRKSKLMQVSNNVPVGRLVNACDAARLTNPMRCDFASIRLVWFVSDAMIENTGHMEWH